MRVGFVLSSLALSAGLSAAALADGPSASDSVHGFRAALIDGQEIDLSQFQGQVLLIVNTASQCGYTSQYEGLQALYERYRDQGFQVLAFPANEFGGQEPGTDAEIREFCTQRYDVSFPLFSKVVVAGEGQHPLYQFLTSKETNPRFSGEIPWNFTKFLVDRQGRVVARFVPKVQPDSAEVTEAIERELARNP